MEEAETGFMLHDFTKTNLSVLMQVLYHLWPYTNKFKNNIA